jgi:hypothetical protein
MTHHTTNLKGGRVSCSSRSYTGTRTENEALVTCKRCLANLAKIAARAEG